MPRKARDSRTDDIVQWIENIHGFESNAVLVAFAKKMKARQFARMLEYEDEDTGMRIKRLWSFRDRNTGGRFYADILEMPRPIASASSASTPGS